MILLKVNKKAGLHSLSLSVSLKHTFLENNMGGGGGVRGIGGGGGVKLTPTPAFLGLILMQWNKNYLNDPKGSPYLW